MAMIVWEMPPATDPSPSLRNGVWAEARRGGRSLRTQRNAPPGGGGGVQGGRPQTWGLKSGCQSGREAPSGKPRNRGERRWGAEGGGGRGGGGDLPRCGTVRPPLVSLQSPGQSPWRRVIVVRSAVGPVRVASVVCVCRGPALGPVTDTAGVTPPPAPLKHKPRGWGGGGLETNPPPHDCVLETHHKSTDTQCRSRAIHRSSSRTRDQRPSEAPPPGHRPRRSTGPLRGTWRGSASGCCRAHTHTPTHTPTHTHTHGVRR